MATPLTDQTILITGATSGLGRQVARELAKQGAHVIAHGRNPERLKEVHQELGVDVVAGDLADLRRVGELAEEITRHYDHLDVLVNNAGIGFGRDSQTREVSADGIELRFAVNYLAGVHLTRKLLPLMRAPGRIVNVASAAQQEIDFADPQLESDYDGTRAYAQSKLAQVMFTIDLAIELEGSGITVNALHPATYMDTTMVREAGIRPASNVTEGAEATLRLITSAELDGVTGRYFQGTTPADPNPQAADPTARQRLRYLTGELIGKVLA